MESTCRTCGVTITYKPWPPGKPKPAWLQGADGYWLDKIGTRGSYRYGAIQSASNYHAHQPQPADQRSA